MREDREQGVRLAHYRQHGAGVLLIRPACRNTRTLALEAVIDRLRARGVGDEQTGICAAAGFVRGPCPRCGGRTFETRPAFPTPQARQDGGAPLRF